MCGLAALTRARVCLAQPVGSGPAVLPLRLPAGADLGKPPASRGLGASARNPGPFRPSDCTEGGPWAYKALTSWVVRWEAGALLACSPWLSLVVLQKEGVWRGNEGRLQVLGLRRLTRAKDQTGASENALTVWSLNVQQGGVSIPIPGTCLFPREVQAQIQCRVIKCI